MLIAGLCAALAVGFAVGAIVIQRSASQPIGEGEVFVSDAQLAAEFMAGAGDPETAVRQARNALEIEGVSAVDRSGVVTASTSPSLLGTVVHNEFLAFSIAQGRFAAVAAPIGAPLRIDGVATWDEGDVLYQVASPTSDGQSVLLHYDISELLGRRARPGGIQPETVQLLGLVLIFAVIGSGVAVGHLRATRRYRALVFESEILRRHADELSAANAQLDEARHNAERALELAEEKIRIRSEFVLMINHELRTPLTSVVTGAELLNQGDLEPIERRQVLEAMVADGSRLGEIIDQILAVARIENKGLFYELEDTPLNDLANHLGTAPSAVIHQPDHLAEGVRALTDVNALSLVVASLAENAITHGASKVDIEIGLSSKIEPMVEVGARPRPAVHILIADDGPGIGEDFLPRVFEKFEKSSFSSGTGLGLYMARTIVEALDGSIGVQTSSRGTAFEISLPAIGVSEMAVTR